MFLRARAMLNSVIHTSQVSEGAEILGTMAKKNSLLCISIGEKFVPVIGERANILVLGMS